MLPRRRQPGLPQRCQRQRDLMAAPAEALTHGQGTYAAAGRCHWYGLGVQWLWESAWLGGRLAKVALPPCEGTAVEKAAHYLPRRARLHVRRDLGSERRCCHCRGVCMGNHAFQRATHGHPAETGQCMCLVRPWTGSPPTAFDPALRVGGKKIKSEHCLPHGRKRPCLRHGGVLCGTPAAGLSAARRLWPMPSHATRCTSNTSVARCFSKSSMMLQTFCCLCWCASCFGVVPSLSGWRIAKRVRQQARGEAETRAHPTNRRRGHRHRPGRCPPSPRAGSAPPSCAPACTRSAAPSARTAGHQTAAA